jgi:hypothetical protein
VYCPCIAISPQAFAEGIDFLRHAKNNEYLAQVRKKLSFNMTCINQQYFAGQDGIKGFKRGHMDWRRQMCSSNTGCRPIDNDNTTVAFEGFKDDVVQGYERLAAALGLEDFDVKSIFRPSVE